MCDGTVIYVSVHPLLQGWQIIASHCWEDKVSTLLSFHCVHRLGKTRSVSEGFGDNLFQKEVPK